MGAAPRVLPVSVVIASRNRPQLLDDTVASIVAGDDVPAEIVLIDQSDGLKCLDPQPARRAGCELRHLSSAVRGLSHARNEGAELARNSVIVFTDDDMTADRAWLRPLTGPLLAGEPRAVVTGRVLPGPVETPGGFVPALVGRDTPAAYAGRIDGDVLAGGNMAIARATLFEIGGFDARLGPGARFPAAEDNDLGFRLLENGCRIIYAPDAVLYHRAWRPPSAYLPLRYSYGKGKGGYYAKHFRFDDRYMLRRMATDLLLRGGRAAKRVRRPRLACGEIAYALGVLTGAVEWLISKPSASAWSAAAR